jgi:hypothetical protein
MGTWNSTMVGPVPLHCSSLKLSIIISPFQYPPNESLLKMICILLSKLILACDPSKQKSHSYLHIKYGGWFASINRIILPSLSFSTNSLSTFILIHLRIVQTLKTPYSKIYTNFCLCF